MKDAVSLQPSIEIWDVLSPLDLFVFVFVLLLTIAAVVWGHYRRSKLQQEQPSFVDYLLMGRQLTLPMFTATLVATWYGGIFGVTEIAFEHGIYNFITQGVFWYVTYIIFALLLVERVRAFKAITLPDLVAKMFGPKAGYLAAVFNFFNVVPIAYAMSLGLLLDVVFGWGFTVSCFVGVLLVMCYSFLGGFRAVVFSDLVQFFVMCSAVLLVAVLSWRYFGGISYLQAQLPASHFSVTAGLPLASLFVWGLIALSTLVDPNFYQRCFAAENPAVARRGILFATLIWCAFDICTTLGGMYARAAIPEAVPGQSYLIYSIQLLPPGLKGLFLAGIVATILSTLDSYIFIASNTVAYDLAPKSFRGQVWLNRLGIILVGLTAVALAHVFEGSIRDVWRTLGAYSAGCLLLPVLIGYIRPGLITQRMFLVGCIAGAIAITVWRNIERSGFWADVDGLFVGVFVTMSGLVVTKLLFEKRVQG